MTDPTRKDGEEKATKKSYSLYKRQSKFLELGIEKGWFSSASHGIRVCIEFYRKWRDQ